MKMLILDNYDSFTYNLYQYLGELGGEPVVCRNDQISIDEVRDRGFSHIVISPGPGSPYVARDIGISHELIAYAEEAGIPLLGVCLGHQVLAVHFGGRVVRAAECFHGRASRTAILEPPSPLFEGLAAPLEVMRYHSLRVEEPSLPKVLRVTARSIDDGTIMAIEHTDRLLWGVQFHPESIGTPEGKQILRRFLDIPQATTRSNVRWCWAGRKRIGGRRRADRVAPCPTARTVIEVGPQVAIGREGTLTVMAGPCSIESESQLDEAAALVHEQGLHILRSSAFRAAHRPLLFPRAGAGRVATAANNRRPIRPGHRVRGHERRAHRLGSRILRHHSDRRRNMQNYDLLRRAGNAERPILLKRGLAATLDELLLAAEHIWPAATIASSFANAESGRLSGKSASR